MTEIPKEFLVNKDTIKDDFPLLAEHLESVKKKDKVVSTTVSTTVSSDFPPDGCGIGIGSSYRDL